MTAANREQQLGVMLGQLETLLVAQRAEGCEWTDIRLCLLECVWRIEQEQLQ